MNFVRSFNALGYEVQNQRQDWSAENENGVCLSLWSREADWKQMTMDTREHAGPIEDWAKKPGNKKRIAHAKRALDEFDGWVDIVKIDGVPGEGYGNASPWVPSDRHGLKWRVVWLDPEDSGHLRLEAQEFSG